uniref:Dihydropteroate synthase n=1 Tax=candidate division WOR-3 bacterium TaxID=2052148 RepID=A0A7V3PSZ5_UNCW3
MRLLSLESAQDLNQELARIGVDPRAWNIFAQKNRIISLKLTRLSPATANILKQTALVTGADCAIHRQVISGRIRQSDCILFATPRQYEEICLRLKSQPECAARLVPIIQHLINRALTPLSSIKIGNQTFDFQHQTYCMGILNITPDSFYDGGKYLDPAAALDHAYQLITAGAAILDLGAESTRPGAQPVPPAEQLRRLLPVLKPLAKKVKIPISIDTTSARVAEAALNAGAKIINDISGLKFDPTLAKVCARHNAGLILMHIRGTPRTMQRHPVYHDLMQEIIDQLRTAVDQALTAGCKPEQLFIDPGIGFGKTVSHNLEILRRLGELRTLGLPIVVGPSRKSFIGKTLNLAPEQRLEGTIAACLVAALNGAGIVRVHDVQPVQRALSLLNAIRFSGVS